MLKIYGVAHSRAFRAIWLANESGIPYEHIPASFGGPNAQCKEPWYLALNPNGRLPTIDDDGLVMWESGAINLYLAEKYKSPLFLTTLEGRARMLQWAFYAYTEVEPPLITLFRNRVFFAPEKRNAALADEAEGTLRARLEVLEQQLGKTRYFGGDLWDMADFMLAGILYVLTRLKLDMDAYLKLEAWLNESINRPAAVVARKLRE
jgi:glutathione S-transferase